MANPNRALHQVPLSVAKHSFIIHSDNPTTKNNMSDYDFQSGSTTYDSSLMNWKLLPHSMLNCRLAIITYALFPTPSSTLPLQLKERFTGHGSCRSSPLVRNKNFTKSQWILCRKTFSYVLLSLFRINCRSNTVRL